MELIEKGISLRDGVLKQIVREDTWNQYFKIPFLIPDLNINIKKYYKISICTNCMGYSKFIKEGYIKNIEDNIDYPNIEFVLLNYNSKDDLDEWTRKNLMSYIEKGIVNYYHTIEPIYYSMTHSRNVQFKLAQGEIVTNVDSDHFVHKGFANRLNVLANNFPNKVIFMKSRQKNRGRLGFYKREFYELGGYDENIKDYGFDDSDILYRANALGYKAAKFTGEFFTAIGDGTRHQKVENYRNPDWKYNQRLNTLISLLNLVGKQNVANVGKSWGTGKFIKNFKEMIQI